MTRDWDATWEHWADMTPEEKGKVHAEIRAGMIAAGAALIEAAQRATAATLELAKALNRAFPEPSAVDSAFTSDLPSND